MNEYESPGYSPTTPPSDFSPYNSESDMEWQTLPNDGLDDIGLSSESPGYIPYSTPTPKPQPMNYDSSWEGSFYKLPSYYSALYGEELDIYKGGTPQFPVNREQLSSPVDSLALRRNLLGHQKLQQENKLLSQKLSKPENLQTVRNRLKTHLYETGKRKAGTLTSTPHSDMFTPRAPIHEEVVGKLNIHNKRKRSRYQY